MANASDAAYDMGKKFVECEVQNGSEKATWNASFPFVSVMKSDTTSLLKQNHCKQTEVHAEVL